MGAPIHGGTYMGFPGLFHPTYRCPMSLHLKNGKCPPSMTIQDGSRQDSLGKKLPAGAKFGNSLGPMDSEIKVSTLIYPT